MKKIVFYFHGYGSNPNSDKVNQLVEAGLETCSWAINIDPDISVPYLEEKILSVILDHLHEPIELYFVGTSLGAWYADKLGQLFESDNVILINPSYDPRNSLHKYGVNDLVSSKYDPIRFGKNHRVYIGTNDEVIDFTDFDFGEAKVTYVEGADHRFKEHFKIVIDYLTQ